MKTKRTEVMKYQQINNFNFYFEKHFCEIKFFP